jgi:hypothetical protein
MSKKIFISHSTADAQFVSLLQSAIECNGLEVWIDTQNLLAGDTLNTEIESAIKHAAAFIVVISPSVFNSMKVRKEIMFAQENKVTIIPILINGMEPPSLLFFFKKEPAAIEIKNSLQQSMPQILKALGIEPPSDIEHTGISNTETKSQDILTNTHNFIEFRENNCLYVDKTQYIYHLLNSKMTHCFFSRPRRFGKSLLVSVMKEMFLGNKELFQGLYVYDKYDFTPYPVIHLSFTRLEYDIAFDADISLSKALTNYLGRIAREIQIPAPDGPYLGAMIEDLSQKFNSPVVLLIDEYDKPLLSYIDEPENRKKVLKVLKNFFSPLKDLTGKIKFLFITGVSKFSQVSIFSDLNNLDDLTLNEDYATIAGFTQQEIEHYFDEHINRLALKNGVRRNDILAQIKSWYDGYSWDGKNFVYAPFSISKLLKHRKFKNYWFASATPSFLIDVIDAFKQGRLSFDSFESYPMLESDMEKYDISNIQLMPFLFQAGYLSIYQIDMDTLKLRIPNMEVRTSFYKHLFNQLSHRNIEHIDKLRKAIRECSIELMMECIKSLIATIPYQILEKKEKVYHSHFYTILRTANENTQSEVSTNLGRIDTVMETPDTVFIFEFKMKSALQGIKQIKEKRYADSYSGKNKKLVLIGVQFSESDRNISDYRYEFY